MFKYLGNLYIRAVFKTKYNLRTCLMRTSPVSAQQERTYCANFTEGTWKKQVDHRLCEWRSVGRI